MSVKQPLTLAQAAFTWLSGWVLGGLASAVVAGAAGYSGTSDQAPVWVYALAAVSMWTVMVAAVWIAVRAIGSGSVVEETRFRFRPVDLLGLPIGALCQLVLVRVIYWPLSAWWPDTFSQERVRRTAQDLYDRAEGAWLVVLVIIVVIGAPLVEEFVYRGLLQGSAERRLQPAAAMVLVAVLFALIHLRPVEYPGLFAFALVIGVCTLVTGRIGMAILAHIAFNAIGLALVAAT